MHLSPYETIWLIGAAIAAALLWGIFASAIKRKGAPIPLLVSISAGALWYTGDALRLLIGQAVPGVVDAADYAVQMARFGRGFLPSAMLATVLAFADEHRISKGLRRLAPPLALAPGAIVFLFGMSQTPPMRVGFSLYAMAALLLSAHLCWRFAARSETEMHRLFYRSMALALAGIAVLTGVAYPLGGIHLPKVGQVLAIALFLSPIVPAYILSHFIYRYSFFQIVVNPALLYSALTGIVLTVYLIVIRRVAEAFGRLDGGLRVEVVEAVLISLLIFLFQPVKNRLQGVINRLFFRARYDYQHLLNTLSQTLNVPHALEKRLQSVVEAVGAVLKVRVVSLVLFDCEKERIRNVQVIASSGLPGFDPPAIPFARGDENSAQIERVVDWLLAHRRPLYVGELHGAALAAILAEQGIQLCLPVLQEDAAVGLLCLGEKKRGASFFSEEWDLLATLCNQIALAVENTRLVERRLQLERQMYEAERLSALGLLSASIAHEVKNPLSSIKAIATVLREDLQTDASKAGDLTVVLREIDRLSRVVDRLLKFAQPKQGAAFQSVDLKAVLEDVVRILFHEAERQNVAIRLDVPDGLAVAGDSEDLKEVFFNLILNGIQAMAGHDADRRLCIAAQRVSPYLEIRVSDTGPGISAEDQARIFEPFYTTKASGTGLGLAIVKRDVARMGGSIAVTNAEPSGAVFAVQLPGAG